TDINGQFQLSLETGTKMLVVSYVRMKTQDKRVPRKEKEHKIVLIPETMHIDEQVVTGYGN
ncbi:carboxypeptidase-like regulatory domain-containing protein, partial [Bacteroides thetaiotaomicron]|uniref:carboxypeptidase-like regulatory domain-containing protein n=1 Tax=Bacteroides thetaiotaomicron TaxID=818 RepID=UPI00210C20C3